MDLVVLCLLRVLTSVAQWEIGFVSSLTRSIHITVREHLITFKLIASKAIAGDIAEVYSNINV